MPPGHCRPGVWSRQGAGQQINGLAQFLEFRRFFPQTLFIHGEALHKMIAQNVGGPLAELSAA